MIMAAKKQDSAVRDVEIIPRHYLLRAWEDAETKKAAPGIDGINVKAFAPMASEEIKRLYHEINNRTYKPRQMIVFEKMKRNGGIRKLAIPCLRDKIVARAESELLSERFDGVMAPQSYAYRNNRGALKAVSAVDKYCNKGYSHVARIDINSFFDRIDHQLLWTELSTLGIIEDEVELLMRFATNPLFDGVRVEVPHIGVPQGTPLAPVLANIYLTPFDRKLNDEKVPFVRYADDIVIFGNDLNEAGNMMNFAIRQLNELKLEGNEEKDRVYAIETGFPFLGFTVSSKGRTPGTEAIARLEDKLTENSYADEDNGEYDSRRKAIVRGWSNYFNHGTSATTTVQPAPEDLTATDENRVFGTAIQLEPDITRAGEDNIVIRPATIPDKPAASVENVIKDAEELYQAGSYDTAMWRLRQALSDEEVIQNQESKNRLSTKLAAMLAQRGLYGAAVQCGANKNIMLRTASPEYGQHDVELWLELFSNEKNNPQAFVQYVDRLGRHGYKPAADGLTKEALQKHWEGKQTLAVPVFNQAGLVRFGVIDFDVTRKSMDTLKLEEIETLKERLLDDAAGIAKIAGDAGIESILEDSGHKGYHLWFIFHAPLKAELVKTFLQALVRIAKEAPAGTHRELFPTSEEYVEDNPGTRIKLPLGVHQLTGKRSKFLLHDRSICEKPLNLLHSKNSYIHAETIRQATAGWNGRPAVKNESVAASSSAINLLYEKCAVLAVLRDRARSEHNLTHYERCILRGVFAPLGESGLKEIHRVLSECSNYRRDYTGKMINGESRSAMGCTKIREMLGMDADKIGCNCRFKPRKNDYANPLRHLSTAQPSAPAVPVRPATANTNNGINNIPCKDTVTAGPTPSTNSAPLAQPVPVTPAQPAVNQNAAVLSVTVNPPLPAIPPVGISANNRLSLWQRVNRFIERKETVAAADANLATLITVYQQKRRELIELQARIDACAREPGNNDITIEFNGPDSKIRSLTIRLD